MLLILCLLIIGVGGESRHGVTRERIIKQERIVSDLPKLSEWNYENPEFRRQLIVQGGKPNRLLFNFQSYSFKRGDGGGGRGFSVRKEFAPHRSQFSPSREDPIKWEMIASGEDFSPPSASEVGGMLADVCRQCMITMDIDCISGLCMIQKQTIDIDISVSSHNISTTDIQHHAFATGTSLHADILCSLCKHTRDVMCTMKLCEDPDRDKYIKDGRVECQQGFCRWQKETVSVTGYNNYYNGWWQPQGWVLWFEDLTKELASAYRELSAVTRRAMQILNG